MKKVSYIAAFSLAFSLFLPVVCHAQNPAGGIPEYISYSTSSSPIGPWTYRGIIMPSQGHSLTNNPGVIDFKGNPTSFIIMVLCLVAVDLHVQYVLLVEV